MQEAGDERGRSGLRGELRRAFLRGEHDIRAEISQEAAQRVLHVVLHQRHALDPVPPVAQGAVRLVVRDVILVQVGAHVGELGGSVPGRLVRAEIGDVPAGGGEFLREELLGDLGAADEDRELSRHGLTGLVDEVVAGVAEKARLGGAPGRLGASSVPVCGDDYRAHAERGF
ncbi:hypothetical protein [Streptomyces sp. NPDC056010]|uniref:hypothetical protein n=1 Tax=Streptomyces sp. NPDC056010 TaxID=3345679 RepID=UPI0035E1A332